MDRIMAHKFLCHPRLLTRRPSEPSRPFALELLVDTLQLQTGATPANRTNLISAATELYRARHAWRSGWPTLNQDP